MGFISGQLVSLTNLIHGIPNHFVNKPQILYCDKALLLHSYYLKIDINYNYNTTKRNLLPDMH